MSPPERRAPRDFDHTSGVVSGTAALADSQISGSTRPPGAPSVALTRQDPWQVMDAWDDAVIVRELHGEAPRGKLVYQFRQQGKDVVGLGKEGVDFACELLSHQGQVIREIDLSYEIRGEGTEQEAHFQAKAGRFAIGTAGELPLETVIAVKRQPLYQGDRLNPHWFEHGAMKALRNARVRLLPLILREHVMAMARADGRVQQDSGKRKTDQEQEPATDKQHELYGQMLASHHVLNEEREKAIRWLGLRQHSKEALSKAIHALDGLIQTRAAAEKERDATNLAHGLPS